MNHPRHPELLAGAKIHPFCLLQSRRASLSSSLTLQGPAVRHHCASFPCPRPAICPRKPCSSCRQNTRDGFRKHQVKQHEVDCFIVRLLRNLYSANTHRQPPAIKYAVFANVFGPWTCFLLKKHFTAHTQKKLVLWRKGCGSSGAGGLWANHASFIETSDTFLFVTSLSVSESHWRPSCLYKAICIISLLSS